MAGTVENGTQPGGAKGNWKAPPVLQARSPRTLPEDPASPIKRISLELSRTCNLRCRYCYSGASPERGGGLGDDDVRAVILEAKEAGARMISIVGGGETLLRRSILTDGVSCIDYANGIGCYCAMYTNCTLVDDRAARWLHARDVTVVGKLNSLRDGVQDELSGVPGSAVRIRRGIDALLRAGFGGSGPPRLALETVICRANYDEMPELWRFMRQRGIVPEVEIPTMHGRAAEHRSVLFFDESEAPEKYRQLFEELLEVDRTEFGFDWIPHPPFAAGSCTLYESNCYINDHGGVQPCAGFEQDYGLLRVGAHRDAGQSLVSILGSEEFRKLRSVRTNVTGACAACELLHECYGCRAAAWHATGDPFAEDPVCWRGARAVLSCAVQARRPLPLWPGVPPVACGTSEAAGERA